MRRRYPFEALRGVREKRVDRHAAELGVQVRKTEGAARERERAQQARESAERRAAEVARGERDRLEQGLARAADLQAATSFARGASQRIDERAAVEKAAHEREQRERSAESRARTALAQADAESQAVEKHRERWQRAGVASDDRAADEESLDHWNARARSRRGSGGAG